MSLHKTLILIGALAATSSAHMVMTTPPPYNKATLTNAPMADDGSDFPCKVAAGGTYAPPPSTLTMAVGAQQTLALMGGATHGGGSCQISLTKDLHPTKDSVWMVIHSVEGGCPNAAPGNFGEDASAPDPTTFPYKIPEGIAPGDYALAWTWFNKIGNREMYMNCAPIKVTGSSKRSVVPEPDSISTDELKANHLNETMADEFNLESRAASFPDMFKANLQIFGGCAVPESVDVEFPNPGDSLVKGSSATLGKPTGNCAGGSAGSSSAGSSGAGSAPAGSSPAASPSAAAPAAPASPGTATILASPSPSAAAGGSAPAGSPSAAPASPAPAAPVAPAAGGSSSSSGCTPGQIVCGSGGTTIGTCDQSGKAVMGPVAAGTKCVAGKVAFANARRDRIIARN